MLQYSPYQNPVNPNKWPLPSILITAGLQDSRVPYFEPAKYAAKLRRLKAIAASDGTGEKEHIKEEEDRPLLLRVTDNGHFANSDPDARYKELAEIYAFILKYL
jgi:oligopeptidase B